MKLFTPLQILFFVLTVNTIMDGHGVVSVKCCDTRIGIKGCPSCGVGQQKTCRVPRNGTKCDGTCGCRKAKQAEAGTGNECTDEQCYSFRKKELQECIFLHAKGGNDATKCADDTNKCYEDCVATNKCKKNASGNADSFTPGCADKPGQHN